MCIIIKKLKWFHYYGNKKSNHGHLMMSNSSFGHSCTKIEKWDFCTLMFLM